MTVQPFSVPPFSPRNDIIVIKELREQTPHMRGLFAAIGNRAMQALGIDITRVKDRTLTAEIAPWKPEIDDPEQGFHVLISYEEFLLDDNGKRIILDGADEKEARCASRTIWRTMQVGPVQVIANDDRDLTEDAEIVPTPDPTDTESETP